MYIIPEIYDKNNPFIPTSPKHVAKLYREQRSKFPLTNEMYDENEYDNININTDIPAEVLDFAFSEMNTHGNDDKE